LVNMYQYLPCLVGSLSPQHGVSSGCGWRNGLQQWRLAANILNKQSRTDNKGWPSSLGVGSGVNNPSPRKRNLLRKLLKSLGLGRDSLDKRPKLWNTGGDVDWIGLAKDRNRWRAVVNSVLNLRVP
jgi:hypothetical protein